MLQSIHKNLPSAAVLTGLEFAFRHNWKVQKTVYIFRSEVGLERREMGRESVKDIMYV